MDLQMHLVASNMLGSVCSGTWQFTHRIINIHIETQRFKINATLTLTMKLCPTYFLGLLRNVPQELHFQDFSKFLCTTSH